jgi:hypothetical protein
MVWKSSLLVPTGFHNVGSATLDIVLCKTACVSGAGIFIALRTTGKIWADQTQQTIKRGIVPAMRRRSEQQQMALFISDQALKEFEPLMSATLAADTGVCLVDDH